MAQSNKKFIRWLLSSKIFLFIVLFALIGLVLNVGRESYHKYQLTKEIRNLETEIKKVEGRNRQLSDLMNYFSEESFLEKEARIKLNLQKPGEKIVIFSDKSDGVDNLNSSTAKATDEQRKEEDISGTSANCWKWWEYFFKQ